MLDRNVVFEYLGVDSISEISRMYNIGTATIRSILIKVNDIAEFNEEVKYRIENISKRRSKINPLGNSKFNKLRNYYSSIEELQFHAANCDDENKIYIFNKFIDLNEFNGIEPTTTKSFKRVLYESILKPGCIVPDCVVNTLGNKYLDCITVDSLKTDIINTVGCNRFIDNMYVPEGYIYVTMIGVITYEEAASLLGIGASRVRDIKSSYTQEEIDLRFTVEDDKYKVLYHNEYVNLKQLNKITGFTVPYLHNNFINGKFKASADWLDSMIQIKPYLVTEKNKCVVYFNGEETTIYALADKFNKDMKTIRGYYFEYDLKQEEIEFILNNNIDLKMYRYGFNVDGEWMLMPDVAKKFNVTVNMIKVLLRKGLTREEVITKLSNERNALLDKSDKAKGVNIKICDCEFNSYLELDRFINVGENTSRSFITKYGEERFIKSYHFKERLSFKENSPYSEWFTDSTWIYKCPICGRKLLMSTEELIDYKHSEELCEEFKIE